MTECKTEESGKDRVCTLFIDLLNRRKANIHTVNFCSYYGSKYLDPSYQLETGELL